MSKKKARKSLLKKVAGIAITVACPPAGVAIGTVVAAKSARKYAQSGHPKDAQGMVTGYDDVLRGSD